MKNQLLKTVMILLVIITVCSCKKEINTTGLNINKSSILLVVENTDTLKVSIIPSNATNQNIIWRSNNSSVAIVNSLGVVTAVSPGKALITATTVDGLKTDTCIVNSIKWTIYKPNLEIGLNANSINCIVADANDNIWCGGDGGVFQFDGANWNTYLSNQLIVSIAIDNKGIKWFGTHGSGISKFDDTNWTKYTTDNCDLPSNNVSSLAIDDNRSIWIGTYETGNQLGTGLSKFDGTTWTFYETNNEITNRDFTSISVDNQGNKWLVAKHVSGTEVLKFDGFVWTSYTESITNNEFLPFVDCMVIDANNNKWFSTAQSGSVLKFDGINWVTYPSNITGLGAINTMAIDSHGSIWFGTDSGVTKFDGSIWIKYPYNKGYYVKSITFDSKGNKWIGTNDGVFKLQE